MVPKYLFLLYHIVTADSQNEQTLDCSYADIDNVHYAPLPTDCAEIDTFKVYCDKDGNVMMEKCADESPIDIETSLVSWQCTSECAMTRFASALLPDALLPDAALLPDPIDVLTESPTVKPTAAPITSSTTNLITSSATQSSSGFLPSIVIVSIQTTDADAFRGDSQSAIKPFASPSIPIHAVCLLITFGLFCGSIYHLLIRKHDASKKNIKWVVKVFVLLTFISNIAGIACIMMVSIIISSTEWTQEAYNMALIPYYGISVAYCFGKFNLECFFLFRVYTAFRNSSYALSKRLCIALICWMFMVSFMWCYMFLGDLKHDNINTPYYLYLLVCILEMLLVFVLLYLFLRRLSELILRHKLNPKVSTPSVSHHGSKSVHISSIMPGSTTLSPHTTSETTIPPTPTMKLSVSGASESASVPSNISISKSFQSNLSTKQTKWIFLMTRCILLSAISLITTLLFGFFAFYGSQFTIDIFIVYALWSIDMTTNSLCLYLNFIFANSFYNKACHLCHGSCQQMVESVAAEQMLKRYLDDVKNIQNTSQQPTNV